LQYMQYTIYNILLPEADIAYCDMSEANIAYIAIYCNCIPWLQYIEQYIVAIISENKKYST
jgi:hypothetical protein